jgi:DNA-binding transcriptional MerR regulator
VSACPTISTVVASEPVSGLVPLSVVAQELHRDVRTLRRWIRSGRLPAPLKRGGWNYYTQADLQRFKLAAEQSGLAQSQRRGQEFKTLLDHEPPTPQIRGGSATIPSPSWEDTASDPTPRPWSQMEATMETLRSDSLPRRDRRGQPLHSELPCCPFCGIAVHLVTVGDNEWVCPQHGIVVPTGPDQRFDAFVTPPLRPRATQPRPDLLRPPNQTNPYLVP